jgi:hypothetical protein
MNKIKMLFLTCLIVNIAACVPYPVYKTLKPEANFLVLDANKKPIEGAKIVLNTRARPTPINEFDIQYTNAKGMTNFASKKELKVENTGQHGALDYFWNLCIEKTGFKTVHKEIENASELSGPQVVNLVPGKSESCRAGEK